MNLPPFPDEYIPTTPEARIRLIAWGEQIRAMAMEGAAKIAGNKANAQEDDADPWNQGWRAACEEIAAAINDQIVESAAKAIYEQWFATPGYVAWVEGGNSFKQDDARRLARKAMDEWKGHE